MPLVKSLSAHPYNGKFYSRGDVYEANASDIELLKSLKRAATLSEKDPEAQKYRTRDMRAEGAGIIGTRGTVPVSNQNTPAEVAAAVNSVEPRRTTRAKTPNKPDAAE